MSIKEDEVKKTEVENVSEADSIVIQLATIYNKPFETILKCTPLNDEKVVKVELVQSHVYDNE